MIDRQQKVSVASLRSAASVFAAISPIAMLISKYTMTANDGAAPIL